MKIDLSIGFRKLNNGRRRHMEALAGFVKLHFANQLLFGRDIGCLRELTVIPAGNSRNNKVSVYQGIKNLCRSFAKG